MSEKIARLDKSVIDMVYPVGAIYMSVNSTNPGNLFGGKWEQIKDRFLLSAGDSYSAGSMGGEATHTLTVDEMPSHGHGLAVVYSFPNGNQTANNWNSGKDISIDNVATGGSQPHNNMPPYLTVYMWKRTA